MIIKIKLAYFILLLIAATQQLEDPQITSRNLAEQQSLPSIYGIRWTLGNAYNLLQSQRNEQQFLLLFNSDKSLGSIAYVVFGKSTYNCRGNQYSLQQFITFQYSCIINQKPNSQNYSIRIGSIDLSGSYQQYHVNSYNQIILYTGVLKFQALGKEIGMLGRIQAIREIDQKVLAIVEDQNVSVVVVSEIIPRINGNNFRDILIYLQPITSRVFTLPITVDNFGKDTFWSSLLFPAFFQSNNNIQAYIFPTFKLRILCLGSQKPQQLIQPLKQALNTHSQHNFLTILLSMYSITESSNQALQSLSDLNIHLNLIQQTNIYRQNKICLPISNKGDQCIYQINEGYITSRRNDLGILKSQINKKNASYQWKHYQNGGEKKSTMLWQQNSIEESHDSNSVNINISAIRKIFITAEALTFLFLASMILLAYIRHRKSIKSSQIHIELVEQIVNGSQPRQSPINP